jgi:hypothetical protein
LLIGPIALVLVANRGIHAVKRASERISKILTVRAKIEQALGLTIPFRTQGKLSDLYWEKESIVNEEHLESRKRHKSSNDFTRYAMNDKKGYLAGIIIFFRIFYFDWIIERSYYFIQSYFFDNLKSYNQKRGNIVCM